MHYSLNSNFLGHSPFLIYPVLLPLPAHISYFETSVIMMLMLSLAVMISICHAVMRLPGYLSWNVPFDGAAIRPITEELSSYIHALPAL